MSILSYSSDSFLATIVRPYHNIHCWMINKPPKAPVLQILKILQRVLGHDVLQPPHFIFSMLQNVVKINKLFRWITCEKGKFFPLMVLEGFALLCFPLTFPLFLTIELNDNFPLLSILFTIF